MTRANGIEHARVGDGRGVAFALQLEFGVVDAARHVGCEHEEKVHLRERIPATVEHYMAGAPARGLPSGQVAH